jgi:lipase chaperone LimK
MKESMLLHQSARLGNYDEEGVLNTEPWKMFRKKDYPAEQWIEVEQALSQSQQQAQVEQPPKSNFPLGGFGGSSGSGKY